MDTVFILELNVKLQVIHEGVGFFVLEEVAAYLYRHGVRVVEKEDLYRLIVY